MCIIISLIYTLFCCYKLISFTSPDFEKNIWFTYMCSFSHIKVANITIWFNWCKPHRRNGKCRQNEQ